MVFRRRQAWLLFALPVLCLAADDPRPDCGSKNRGQFWPEAANHDPKLLSQLARCGELLVCVRRDWRYQWESPTIRVDQLARNAKAKASEPAVCEVQAAVSINRGDRSPTDKPE